MIVDGINDNGTRLILAYTSVSLTLLSRSNRHYLSPLRLRGFVLFYRFRYVIFYKLAKAGKLYEKLSIKGKLSRKMCRMRSNCENAT